MELITHSKKHMTALHVAVLLFGLAGLFGKLLDVSPMRIVVGRTFFAALTLGFIVAFTKRYQILPGKKDLLILCGLGILLAFHWWTFFYAIRISTVAVGLLGFAAFPMFVTFMEPYFFRERFRLFDLCTAAAIMIGLTAVAWPIDLSTGRTMGVVWGMFSGFLFAVLALLNRKIVQNHSPVSMGCFQNCVACLTLLPFALVSSEAWSFSWIQLGLLLFLGVFCTALSHALFIYSLAVVRAQLAGIVASLEPVYGIVFAFFLLGEVPNVTTMVGGVLILGTTIAATRWRQ